MQHSAGLLCAVTQLHKRAQKSTSDGAFGNDHTEPSFVTICARCRTWRLPRGVNSRTMHTHLLEAIPKSRAFRIEVCESLSRSPLFKDWSWEELDTLSSYMTGYRAKAGDLLFQEGDVGDAMGLLLTGAIEVRKHDTAGLAQVVTQIVAGRTFGEMAVIDGEKRSATCVATEPCVLALLPKAQFERILAVNEALGIKLLLRVTRMLSERLRKVSGALVDFLSKDAA